MDFHETIKTAALEYARANAIVMPGDYVFTQWSGWKKPHKVLVCSVGAGLRCGEFDPQKREFHAELAMTYYALRLKADGTRKDIDTAIVLMEFSTESGVKWKRTKETFNSPLVHWDLPESWPYNPATKRIDPPNSTPPSTRRQESMNHPRQCG